MTRSNIYEVEVVFQHQTEKAVCVREHESAKDTWIPKSRCEITPEAPGRGEIITLTSDEATLADCGLI